MTIRVSMRTLMRNKMRTLLTMLGMIFGVGAVVAMLSIGEGAKRQVLSTIEASGTNLIEIYSWKITKEGRWESYRTLTIEDGEAIKKASKYVTLFTPTFHTDIQAVHRNYFREISLDAGSEDYMEIRGRELKEGRNFSPSEVRSAAAVAIVGTKVVDELFEGHNPVGQSIRIKQVAFTVIGVFKAKGDAGWLGDLDDMVVIPYTTYRRKIRRSRRIWRIMLASANREDSEKARDDITSILRQRHHIKSDEEDDFTIRTQEDRIQSAQESNQVLTLLLGSIGSVSLLVGGIGIMNIMLVSVTERMREIGIRMAVGARQRDVMAQFLVEASMISLFGGIFGILTGVGAAAIFAKFSQWKTYVSPGSVVVSFLFSAVVGIFFGFYPAWKASKLNPIKTLRRE